MNDQSSLDELRARIGALEKAVSDTLQQSIALQTGSGWDRFWICLNKVTSSGLFFMIFGVAFLLVAAMTLTRAHASFSFVLVVVGVAVLLFGTGTQGVGEAQATGWKVAIAGGAGIIAFCVGWGIIHYADDIKTVFQIEKKYIRITMVGGDGSSAMSSYAATFSIDGVGVPSARYEDYFEVLVPYLSTEWRKGAGFDQSAVADSSTKLFRSCATPGTTAPDMHTAADTSGASDSKDDEYLTKTLRASFFRVVSNTDLREGLHDLVTVHLRKSAVITQDGGLDFPLYPSTVCVYLLSSEKADTDLKATGQTVDTVSPNKSPLKKGPDPLIPKEAGPLTRTEQQP